MKRRHRARQGEDAQAIVETALIFPALLAVLLLFVGVIFLAEAVNEVRSATTVATVSAFSAPAGAPRQALGAVSDSFQQSISANWVTDRTITCPTNEGNGYLYTGSAAAGTYVSCHGSAQVDFSRTPLALLWRWTVRIQQDASVPVPAYRQCAPGAVAC